VATILSANTFLVCALDGIAQAKKTKKNTSLNNFINMFINIQSSISGH
jgi:hypothetical protein